MTARARKSSACVTLALIGAAALNGCSRTETSTWRRDQYATKADCLADWGNPGDCEERPVTTGGTTRSYWWGPSYL